MQTELDAIPPTRKAPMATGFSVPPRSDLTKLIGFASCVPGVSISEGDYKFELYAVVNGKKSRKPKLTFNIEITTDTIETINQGNLQIYLGHYKL